MGEPLGVVLQLGSCLGSASGYVLQKAAHLQNEKLAPQDQRPLWRSPKWLLGLVFMIVAAGCAVASAPLLDASKQATLGAATIVFNGILAAWLLGDQLTVLDGMGIVTIVLGTVVALAQAQPSKQYTFDATLALLEDGLVYGYVGLAFPLVAATAVIVERTAALPQDSWASAQRSLMATAPPFLGGFCNNQVLYTSKVLTTALFGGEAAALRNPVFYLYVLLAAGAVYGQVRWLNTGLAFFPASLVVPIFQVTIILGGALAGIVYYHDMRTSPPGVLAAFVVGALVCAGGIGLLQLKARRQQAFAAAEEAAAAAAGGGGTASSKEEARTRPDSESGSGHDGAAATTSTPLAPAAARAPSPLRSHSQGNALGEPLIRGTSGVDEGPPHSRVAIAVERSQVSLKALSLERSLPTLDTLSWRTGASSTNLEAGGPAGLNGSARGGALSVSPLPPVAEAEAAASYSTGAPLPGSLGASGSRNGSGATRVLPNPLALAQQASRHVRGTSPALGPSGASLGADAEGDAEGGPSHHGRTDSRSAMLLDEEAGVAPSPSPLARVDRLALARLGSARDASASAAPGARTGSGLSRRGEASSGSAPGGNLRASQADLRAASAEIASVAAGRRSSGGGPTMAWYDMSLLEAAKVALARGRGGGVAPLPVPGGGAAGSQRDSDWR